MPAEAFHLDPPLWDSFRALCWCAVYLACGLGAWSLQERGRARAMAWSPAFAMGLAVAGWLLALGAWARAMVVAELLVLTLAVGGLLYARASWVASLRRFAAGSFQPVPALLAGLTVLAWVLAAPVMIRPNPNYDVLSYHLPLAHHLFRGGGLDVVAGNYYSRLPLLAFALYGPLLSDATRTFDDVGVRALLWSAFVAASLMCGRLAGHLGARRTGQWGAALLFAWLPTAWDGVLNGHSDLLTALFGLAAFERAFSGLASRGRVPLVWSGLLAGSAVAVKFSAAGIVGVPLALFLLGVSLVRGGPSLARRAAVCYTAGGLISYGLWAFRATWFFGHPLHPFAGEAPGWTAGQAAFLLDQHHPRSPLSPDFWQAALAQADPTGFGGAGAWVLIPAIILLLWDASRSRRGVMGLLVVAVFMGYAAWLTVGLAPRRFVLPMAGVLVAILGQFLGGLRRRDLIGHLLVGVLLALVISTAAPHLRTRHLLPWRGDVWRMPLTEDIVLAARDTAGERRVLLLFEARGRPFGPRAEITTVWDVPSWVGELRVATDGRDFAQRLVAAGYGSVVVNEFELGRLLAFYGGLEADWRTGPISLAGGDPEADRLLAAYPPARFAGLDSHERGVLLQFLDLSRRGAVSRIPAGQSAEIWVTPLLANPVLSEFR